MFCYKYRLANNKATNSNLDEENRNDDKKLSDPRNKNKINPIHNLRFWNQKGEI